MSERIFIRYRNIPKILGTIIIIAMAPCVGFTISNYVKSNTSEDENGASGIRMEDLPIQDKNTLVLYANRPAKAVRRLESGKSESLTCQVDKYGVLKIAAHISLRNLDGNEYVVLTYEPPEHRTMSDSYEECPSENAYIIMTKWKFGILQSIHEDTLTEYKK